jgi:hypothetical protein
VGGDAAVAVDIEVNLDAARLRRIEPDLEAVFTFKRLARNSDGNVGERDRRLRGQLQSGRSCGRCISGLAAALCGGWLTASVCRTSALGLAAAALALALTGGCCAGGATTIRRGFTAFMRDGLLVRVIGDGLLFSVALRRLCVLGRRFRIVRIVGGLAGGGLRQQQRGRLVLGRIRCDGISLMRCRRRLLERVAHGRAHGGHRRVAGGREDGGHLGVVTVAAASAGAVTVASSFEGAGAVSIGAGPGGVLSAATTMAGLSVLGGVRPAVATCASVASLFALGFISVFLATLLALAFLPSVFVLSSLPVFQSATLRSSMVSPVVSVLSIMTAFSVFVVFSALPG